MEKAELMAGIEVQSAYVGIAGEHISSLNSRGVVAAGGPTHEITVHDKERVIEAARSVAIPFDREVLHVLPQEYIVDDQGGINDPIGMAGVRLETNVHIVTGAVSAAQNVCKSVQRAEIEVEDIVLEPLASAQAVLEEDEKEMGICLVDIGGGTTDLALFFQRSVRHTSVIGLGGQNVTGDVAICLRTSWPHAEMIKCTHGSALALGVDEADVVDVPGVAGRPPQPVQRRELATIVEARMEEIFSLVRDEIRRTDYAPLIGAGVVLTGGGSLLEGVADLGEQVLDMPVRLGTPRGFQGLGDTVASPIYATALGLVLMGAEELRDPTLRVQQRSRELSEGRFDTVLGRMKEWLQTLV